MKIIVTGGCGFIGSHLVDRLIDLNHQVIVIDDNSASNEKFYYNKHAEYHKIDICDQENLLNLSNNCEFIFHLAAESRLQLATLNPKRAIDVNIGGTLSVLESCRKNNIGLIFSSTSSIYGLCDKFPITENFKENCLNPYASTKYAAELLIKNYYSLHNVKSSILRYFNVFGERAPSQGQYALVTSIFLKQKKNNEALTVIGDGQQKRDFIYVKDVVDANIKCMENWNLVNRAETFNIGSGKEVSILDLAKTLSNNISFLPPRSGEAINNLCSNYKFKNLTNWKPTISILDWIKNEN